MLTRVIFYWCKLLLYLGRGRVDKFHHKVGISKVLLLGIFVGFHLIVELHKELSMIHKILLFDVFQKRADGIELCFLNEVYL
jgi:hypothetical protein